MPSMNQSGSRLRAGLAGPAARPRRDVELERVHELVADDVVGVGERSARSAG